MLQAEEDDEITRPPRKYNRKSRSIIWKHVTKRSNEKLILCNHCDKKWTGLSGSTSNPLKHLRELHYNRLSDEDKGSLSNNSATSTPAPGGYAVESLGGTGDYYLIHSRDRFQTF